MLPVICIDYLGKSEKKYNLNNNLECSKICYIIFVIFGFTCFLILIHSLIGQFNECLQNVSPFICKEFMNSPAATKGKAN